MTWSLMYLKENNMEKSVNKTYIQYLNNYYSPRTYLNCIFIFKHILVQAKKQSFYSEICRLNSVLK